MNNLAGVLDSLNRLQ
jgi:hypothetical protein